MVLPTDFQFSQGSLQDYVDCPQRFHLRYLRHLAWPAIQAEPPLENERHLQQGVVFHRLIHQHLLGLPSERLVRAVTDEDLSRWWHNYMKNGPADLPPSHSPEILLSAPVSGHRLVAKYDLIAVDAGRRAVIVDWKTSPKRPQRKWLAERLQTRIYPYVLVRVGAHLNGGAPIEPQHVEMVYWFANTPADPERFCYDTAQFEADGAYLASLIEEIKDLREDEFLLTPDERRCRYCLYRSYCQRGGKAGSLESLEEDLEPGDDFGLLTDFEQIAEIEY